MQITCPTCKQKTEWEENPFRPFCSERCKTRDLGNWASGKYAVPVEEFDDEVLSSTASPEPEEDS